MDFITFKKIDEVVKKYDKERVFRNAEEDLHVQLIANVSDESKEFILYEFDSIIPCGTIFPHTYENGILKVDFKEVA